MKASLGTRSNLSKNKLLEYGLRVFTRVRVRVRVAGLGISKDPDPRAGRGSSYCKRPRPARGSRVYQNQRPAKRPARPCVALTAWQIPTEAPLRHTHHEVPQEHRRPRRLVQARSRSRRLARSHKKHRTLNNKNSIQMSPGLTLPPI